MHSEIEWREGRYTGEVAALEGKTVQFLAGLFGVLHHFVHDIRSAFRIRMDSLANLAMEISAMLFLFLTKSWANMLCYLRLPSACYAPDRAVLAEEFKQIFSGGVVSAIGSTIPLCQNPVPL